FSMVDEGGGDCVNSPEMIDMSECGGYAPHPDTDTDTDSDSDSATDDDTEVSKKDNSFAFGCSNFME
ncbi:MAG TPA: hypothetical protein VLJ60_11340, partial [bacterium]|nr:hypothetical protein [bacterium]